MNKQNIHPITAVNGFLAMAVGMTLILYALQEGNVGMVLFHLQPLSCCYPYYGFMPSKGRMLTLGSVRVAVVGTGILVRW